MGRASHALKQVLERFGISQNKLAVTLGIDRSAVFKWFHEQREPTSETIVEITMALKQLNSEAAERFVYLYLGELLESETRLESEASLEDGMNSENEDGVHSENEANLENEIGSENDLNPEDRKVENPSDGMVE